MIFPTALQDFLGLLMKKYKAWRETLAVLSRIP